MKGKEVGDLDASLRITHAATADLDIFLIAPNGATVALANDNPGSSGTRATARETPTARGR